jgi:glycosyltransferase involved in cell wall biosynthesis
MKILQVLNHFFPNQTAGTEVYVWALAKRLMANGEDVKVVVPNYDQFISADYQYDQLPVYQFSEPSIVDRSLIMGFRTPDGLKSFVEYLNTEKPDIIHFHEIAGSNGITIHHVKAAKKSGAKVLFTFHLAGLSCMTGTLYQYGETLCNGKIEIKKCTECYLNSKDLKKTSIKLLSFLSSCLYRLGINPLKLSNTLSTALGTAHLVIKKQVDLFKLISYCDKVVVITKWYKEIILSNGIAEENIVFIPQALPINIPPIDHDRDKSNKIRFLFIGRISHFKGIHLLIEAYCKLDQSNVELHIYGQSDGSDYENKLKQQTKSFSSIHWHGTLEQKEVVSLMSEFDALCLCSTFSEMSPLVIQEAFAAGLPVIASNVYGNAEQIMHNVNGLLFNFNDPIDLLKKLRRCLDEKDLLQSLSKNIKPHRSFDEVGKEHINLYKSMLN